MNDAGGPVHELRNTRTNGEAGANGLRRPLGHAASGV